MIRKLLIFSLLLFQFMAFGAYSQQSKTIIQGKIDSIPNAVYYVSYYNAGNHVNDTITLDRNSEFSYELNSTEPISILISIPNDPNSYWYDARLVGNYSLYRLWADPYKTLYFEGKKNKEQHVQNSVTEDDFLAFKSAKDLHLLEIDKTDRKKRNAIGDSIERDYIAHNHSKFYALNLLSWMLNAYDTNREFIQSNYDNLTDSLKNTYLGQETRKKIDIYEQKRIAAIFPSIALHDSTGSLVDLASYKGKYVLIEFWASWCAPCRKKHPQLRELYKEFKSEDFEIIAISLDDNKEDWTNAIAADNLPWVHISDLKGMRKGISKELYIHSIPQNFLLDRSGVILAKNIYGDQLSAKIKTLLKN